MHWFMEKMHFLGNSNNLQNKTDYIPIRLISNTSHASSTAQMISWYIKVWLKCLPIWYSISMKLGIRTVLPLLLWFLFHEKNLHLSYEPLIITKYHSNFLTYNDLQIYNTCHDNLTSWHLELQINVKHIKKKSTKRLPM